MKGTNNINNAIADIRRGYLSESLFTWGVYASI